MTTTRAYTCPGCQGKVSIPKGNRRLALEAVKQNHQESCPRRTTK